jgi:hypothetical protein
MIYLLKFFQLPFAEKILFFQACHLLTIYRIHLLVTPVQDLFYQVQSRSRNIPLTPSSIPPVRMSRLIQIASHFVPGSTCLSNALAGQLLFAGHGYKTQLHIGVARNEQNILEAHAWLSLNGTILIGNLPDLSRFTELPPLPATP